MKTITLYVNIYMAMRENTQWRNAAQTETPVWLLMEMVNKSEKKGGST